VPSRWPLNSRVAIRQPAGPAHAGGGVGFEAQRVEHSHRAGWATAQGRRWVACRWQREDSRLSWRSGGTAVPNWPASKGGGGEGSARRRRSPKQEAGLNASGADPARNQALAMDATIHQDPSSEAGLGPDTSRWLPLGTALAHLPLPTLLTPAGNQAIESAAPLPAEPCWCLFLCAHCPFVIQRGSGAQPMRRPTTASA